MDPFTWLESRRPAAPASLLAAVRQELERTPGEAGQSLAGRLAGAGLRTLEEVAGGDGDRAVASRLLAADALITYACEAAAESGSRAVTTLVQQLSPARFEALLEGARDHG